MEKKAVCVCVCVCVCECECVHMGMCMCGIVKSSHSTGDAGSLKVKTELVQHYCL